MLWLLYLSISLLAFLFLRTGIRRPAIAATLAIFWPVLLLACAWTASKHRHQ